MTLENDKTRHHGRQIFGVREWSDENNIQEATDPETSIMGGGIHKRKENMFNHKGRTVLARLQDFEVVGRPPISLVLLPHTRLLKHILGSA